MPNSQHQYLVPWSSISRAMKVWKPKRISCFQIKLYSVLLFVLSNRQTMFFVQPLQDPVEGTTHKYVDLLRWLHQCKAALQTGGALLFVPFISFQLYTCLLGTSWAFCIDLHMHCRYILLRLLQCQPRPAFESMVECYADMQFCQSAFL